MIKHAMDPAAGHGLEGFDGDARVSARCACGWTSIPALSVESAEARWRIHLAKERAAISRDRASRTHARAVQRSAELVEIWAAARVRRFQIRTQQVGGIEMERRDDTMTFESEERPGLLETARLLAGMSLAELWVDYVALGGDERLSELADHLRDDRGMRPLDHDLVALALNERFADTGLGRPMDYRSGSNRQPEGV